MTTTPRLRRRALAAALTASWLTLTACGATPPGQADQSLNAQNQSGQDQAEASQTAATEVLDRYGLADMDAREVIEHLDTMPVAERPTTLLASVQPTELVLTDTAGGAIATLPMPDEQFYLAVAPYEDQTHDCLFHSLTTCLGEMDGEPVDITVTDEAGQTVLDETRTAYDNGFVGLWLPRDLTGTLKVEHDGKSSTVPISTGDDDLTCLTTAHLT
ncbi:CueP family metal-binding protein [Dietzia kunjamensis]|uniref:CueP family metal-binding protein n=1 Tax=Dietzia kunjamensis TaxID=322509 RepID=UPI0024BA9A6C|nr:CueP family metal-binding protein [Dietzia kunjamensis]MDJ0422568.1 CueP family metal-binding protein [Dietzia kunjamensis]